MTSDKSDLDGVYEGTGPGADPDPVDDPFDCFGDESDEDNDDDNDDIDNHDNTLNHEEQSRAMAAALMEKANQRIDSTNHQQKHLPQPNDPAIIAAAAASTSKTSAQELPPLPPRVHVPFSPPLYMGPMQIISSHTGGNRGYIATRDLAPGTLLLVEEPIFQWTEEQIGEELGLVSVNAIIGHENGKGIIGEMEALHPTKERVDEILKSKNGKISHGTKCTSVTKDEEIQIQKMMEIMELTYSPKTTQIQLKATLELARSANIHLEPMDVFRLLLAMRYNGFGSGIYLHFAMFNHDNDCNCVKFVPNTSANANKNADKIEGKGEAGRKYSEVRTTKYVKRGDALTLDYLDPREQSYATKRWHLWDQHRFDIGSGPLDGSKTLEGEDEDADENRLEEMDLINGKFPPSSHETLDRNSDTFHIETALKELEEQQNEVKLAWQLMQSLTKGKKNKKNNQSTESSEALKMFEHAKAIAEATFELTEVSEKKLHNPFHILLIRCCRLYLDAAETVLQMGTVYAPLFGSNQFGPIGGYRIMKHFVLLSHKLLTIQTEFLGEDHPDVARTNHDLANMIQSMICHCPRELYGCGLEELGSFGKCQRMEAEYRKEFRRIDALYPDDVDEKMKEMKDLI